jgi:hypothetical protein
MRSGARKKNIVVRPKNPNMRWIAIDVNYKLISEGRTPKSAANKATKTGLFFYLAFVPKEGRSTYYNVK